MNGGVSGLIEELDPGAAMAAAALGRARQWHCGHESMTRSSGAASWCRCGANGGAYGTGGGLWWEVGELGLGPAMVTRRPGARDGERENRRERFGEEEEEDDMWDPRVSDREDELYVFIYACGWAQAVSIRIQWHFYVRRRIVIAHF